MAALTSFIVKKLRQEGWAGGEGLSILTARLGSELWLAACSGYLLSVSALPRTVGRGLEGGVALGKEKEQEEFTSPE